MAWAIRWTGGEPVDLRAIDPDADGGLDKALGEARLAALAKELGDLQELLYAAATEALLVILQGMDTSGKDGTIRHVFVDVDPQGIRVVPFMVPTPLELAHDILWRVHHHAPEKGMMVVFNRSHYEDVLVPRVRGLVPAAVWRDRYDHINAFERLLTAGGTIVAKFYLHIGKEEQEERLLARERDVAKAWKLSSGDWVERRSWDDYVAAYQDAINACSTAAAPWYVVSANRKWFRNLAVAEALVDTLRPYRESWLGRLRERGEAELVAIRAARKGKQQ